jgi:hypothetical protein
MNSTGDLNIGDMNNTGDLNIGDMNTTGDLNIGDMISTGDLNIGDNLYSVKLLLYLCLYFYIMPTQIKVIHFLILLVYM